jgi:hypothetical protein
MRSGRGVQGPDNVTRYSRGVGWSSPTSSTRTLSLPNRTTFGGSIGSAALLAFLACIDGSIPDGHTLIAHAPSRHRDATISPAPAP